MALGPETVLSGKLGGFLMLLQGQHHTAILMTHTFLG